MRTFVPLYFLLCAALYGDAAKLGAYFANWAQYRIAPYTYAAEQLRPIIQDLDVLYYGFAKFDHDSEQIQPIEPNDPQYYQQIVAMKSMNPNLKFALSIGGWNFNSADFSKMTSTNASRAAFISSVLQYTRQYNIDGVDFDWEFPCSPPRTDYVKFNCQNIQPHQDAGGKCPDDTNNFLYLVQELRQRAPTMWISVAGQAAPQKFQNFRLQEMSQYIDMWNIMTYDFSVSNLPDTNLTAPNCPLYNPGPAVPGPAASWSVDTSLKGYLAAGVPKEKIMLGTALYGHTWWTPGLAAAQWQRYGVPASIQGECCGPFKNTYGAKYGDGSIQCGSLMASEIIAKIGALDGPSIFFENTTQTNIAYASDGTWITFDNANTLGIKVDYALKYGIAGVFTFDTSMDTIENGQFTYQLMKGMRSKLGPMPPAPPAPPVPPPPPSPVPSPSPSPTPPSPAGCTGKPDGMYCVDTTHYEWCPSGAIQSCQPGLHCQQQGNVIYCV